MSYGFHLFRVSPGQNPMTAYGEQLKDEEAKAVERMRGIDNRVPIDTIREEMKRSLANALIDRRRGLRLPERDYLKAANQPIGLTEDSSESRGLELTERGLGLQVVLFDNTAAVRIPFWRQERMKAELALRAAWECLQVLESEGKFSTYDSQIGRVLDLESDFETIMKGYAGMIRTVDQSLRRPRWKFW